MFEKLLRKLRKQLESTDVFGVGPHGEVREIDEVVGKLPDELQKLYCISQSMDNRAKRAIRAKKDFSGMTSEDIVELAKRHVQMSHDAYLLDRLFWELVDETFPQTAGLPRSIKKGWLLTVPRPDYLLQAAHVVLELMSKATEEENVTFVTPERFERALRILHGEDVGTFTPRTSPN